MGSGGHCRWMEGLLHGGLCVLGLEPRGQTHQNLAWAGPRGSPAGVQTEPGVRDGSGGAGLPSARFPLQPCGQQGLELGAR